MSSELNLEQIVRLSEEELERRLIADLSEWEIKEIFGDEEDDRAEYLFDKFGKDGVSKALSKWIDHIVPMARGALVQKVCIEFDYCGKREDGDLDFENLDVIGPLIDIILVILSELPLTSCLSLATYLIKTKVLDRLCECTD